jgi:hypothetical protein
VKGDRDSPIERSMVGVNHRDFELSQVDTGGFSRVPAALCRRLITDLLITDY